VTPEKIAAVLNSPAHERLREWAAIGPVQRAEVESFADAVASPLPAVQTVPKEAILHRMKYHFRKADPSDPESVDDWDLYEPTVECADCIDVLIVRSDRSDATALHQAHQKEGA
jgi:hypothetical protein